MNNKQPKYFVYFDEYAESVHSSTLFGIIRKVIKLHLLRFKSLRRQISIFQNIMVWIFIGSSSMVFWFLIIYYIIL
jgi:hypothetical protein